MVIDLSKKSFYTLEKKYPISMSEKDMNYSLKPASLLNFLQDTASCNIAGTPFGNVELNEQNLGWFLARYRIEFDRYPQNIDEIIVQTENRGTLRQTAHRDFEAFTTSGDRILRGTTSWLMVDLENKSLVNVSQKFPDIKSFEKREDDVELQKLRTPSEFDSGKMFHVRYDDLDMNGHVNNTVYITWALETLDMDFRNSHTIKAIDIYYKHEVKYGEDITSCVKTEDDFTCHVIKNAQTNEELCLLRIEWIN